MTSLSNPHRVDTNRTGNGRSRSLEQLACWPAVLFAWRGARRSTCSDTDNRGDTEYWFSYSYLRLYSRARRGLVQDNCDDRDIGQAHTGGPQRGRRNHGEQLESTAGAWAMTATYDDERLS